MATVDSFPHLEVRPRGGLPPGASYRLSFDPHESHYGGAFIVTASANEPAGRTALRVSDMSVVIYRGTGGVEPPPKVGVDCLITNSGDQHIVRFDVWLTRIKP